MGPTITIMAIIIILLRQYLLNPCPFCTAKKEHNLHQHRHERGRGVYWCERSLNSKSWFILTGEHWTTVRMDHSWSQHTMSRADDFGAHWGLVRFPNPLTLGSQLGNLTMNILFMESSVQNTFCISIVVWLHICSHFLGDFFCNLLPRYHSTQRAQNEICQIEIYNAKEM